MPVRPAGEKLPRKQYELTPEVIEDAKIALEACGLPPVIYKFENEGDVFVFRPLYRRDWLEIDEYVQANQNTVRQESVDLKICEKAIVWPGELLDPIHWDFLRAGYQSTLAKFILSRSGFFDDTIDQSQYMRIEPLSTVEMGPKPGPEVIDQLKKQHNWALKLVQIDSEYFVVRPLKRLEWKTISSAEDTDLDLITAEAVTVWSKEYPHKPNFGDKLAGTVRALSQIIMEISGFNIRPVVEAL
jgi:hypothetical protein